MVWDDDYAARMRKAEEDRKRKKEAQQPSEYSSQSEKKGGCGLGALIFVLVLSLAGLVALVAPRAQAESIDSRPTKQVANFDSNFRANHITTWDCGVWDQQRGGSSSAAGLAERIRWSFSDVNVKPYEFHITNFTTRAVDITLKYLATSHSSTVWRTRSFTVNADSTYHLYETFPIHSQYYHPAVDVYKNGAIVGRLGPYTSSTQGTMTKVASLTNCTPKV